MARSPAAAATDGAIVKLHRRSGPCHADDHRRQRPRIGDLFSPHALCCRPATFPVTIVSITSFAAPSSPRHTHSLHRHHHAASVVRLCRPAACLDLNDELSALNWPVLLTSRKLKVVHNKRNCERCVCAEAERAHQRRDCLLPARNSSSGSSAPLRCCLSTRLGPARLGCAHTTLEECLEEHHLNIPTLTQCLDAKLRMGRAEHSRSGRFSSVFLLASSLSLNTNNERVQRVVGLLAE
jgi:hypothetical protein